MSAISASADERAQGVVAWLERTGSQAGREAMARYAIPSDRAFGVAVGVLKQQAKKLGPDHALALALWQSGSYEARMLASFVDDPAQVTPAQMERWCREFDNWAICDTACFALFDRTPHAWAKLAVWSGRRDEYVRRAAFALLWGLTVHDKKAADAPFLDGLARIEAVAEDERHLVKKALNMALRAVGKRNPALHAAALACAERLSASPQPSARWIGRDALRELAGPSVQRRLGRRPAA